MSRSLRRVEITDDKAKRPTMGGSNEPPILLPKRIEQQAKQLCTPKAQTADSAALSAPANMQETNTTTGDHHAEQNARRLEDHDRQS